MKTRVPGKSPSNWLVLVLAAWFLSGSLALSDDTPVAESQKGPKWAKLLPRRKPTSQGTLGYGPPGLQTGLPGLRARLSPRIRLRWRRPGSRRRGRLPALWWWSRLPPPGRLVCDGLDRSRHSSTTAASAAPGPSSPTSSTASARSPPTNRWSRSADDSSDPAYTSDYGCFTGSLPLSRIDIRAVRNEPGREDKRAERSLTPPTPSSSVPPTARRQPIAGARYGARHRRRPGSRAQGHPAASRRRGGKKPASRLAM